jgi:hypothetical protein
VNNPRIAKPLWKAPLTKSCALFLSSFVLLSVIYYFNFRRFPLSSDDANSFLEGYDLSAGNWRLKGWWLAEDNYITTDLLFEAMLLKCLGVIPQIMFYLPAMLWAGVAVLAVILAELGLSPRNKLLTVALLTPILVPITWEKGFLHLISHAPAHVATIIYVLLCFRIAALTMSEQTERFGLLIATYTVIMVLAVFGDPLSIFIGAIPLIAVAAFSTLYGRNSSRHRILLVMTIMAVLVAKMLLILNVSTGGFEFNHLQMRFVAFADLGKNAAWVCQYFFSLFGCDFFGKELLDLSTHGTLLALIRLPFLALLIFAVVNVYKRLFSSFRANDSQWPRVEGDYLDALIVTALTINIIAALFSTQIVNETTIRYLFPSLVFGAILIARAQIVTRWVGSYLLLGLSISLVMFSFVCWQVPRRAVLVSDDLKLLSNWLSKKELTRGYGPYWSSSIVTAATGNRVKVRALVANPEGKLVPFQWAAKKQWYQLPTEKGLKSVFVLVRQDKVPCYSEADVIRTLGQPKETQQVGPYIVNLYDPDNVGLRSLCFPLATAS